MKSQTTCVDSESPTESTSSRGDGAFNVHGKRRDFSGSPCAMASEAAPGAESNTIMEAPETKEEEPQEEKKGGASRFYPIYSLRWFLSVFDPWLPGSWCHAHISEWHTGVRIPAAEARFAFECSKVGVPENIRNTVYWLTFPPLFRVFFPGLNWFLFKWYMIIRWGPTFVPWAIEQIGCAPMRLLVYFMGGLMGPDTWKRL